MSIPYYGSFENRRANDTVHAEQTAVLMAMSLNRIDGRLQVPQRGNVLRIRSSRVRTSATFGCSSGSARFQSSTNVPLPLFSENRSRS